jgi:1-acyl-sn-glycerol-3-phosphate acyltransferase
MEVMGSEHIPASVPCLVVCNHYSRPGFQAWWVALSITSALADRRAPGAEDISWVMTAAWRFEGKRWRQRYLTQFSRRVFARVAEVYGFVTMPPMPPAPEEMADRAVAVLRTVRLAHQLARTGGVLGLAPEGRDVPTGLAEPPLGAGTFIAHLVNAGLIVLPAAVSEVGGRLRVSFGPPFVPTIPASRSERDEEVSTQVMAAIARLLP